MAGIGSGWTAEEQAIFNGDMPNPWPAVVYSNLKQNGTTTNGATQRDQAAAGRHLPEEHQVLVITLGATQKDRDCPVFEPTTDLSINGADLLFLVATCPGSIEGELVLQIPLPDNRINDPLVFTLPASLQPQLLFKVKRETSDASQHTIARGSIVLSTESHLFGGKRESLFRDHSVLLRTSEDMSALARFTFSSLIVKSYQGSVPLPVNLGSNPIAGVEIVGHRGLGQNTTDKTYLQLGENTFESFTTAARLGAAWVEFDVQLTRDLATIIYHDYSLSETGTDVPIHDLTFDQFMYAGNIQSDRYNSSTTQPPDGKIKPHRKRMSLSSGTDNVANEVRDRIRQTVAFSSKGFKGNTRGDYVQDTFTTLEELLTRLPPDLGFDIELKYPRPFEAAAANLAPVALEVNTFVDTVLEKLAQHAQGRRIVLSSFTPEVCIALALKQQVYPVMFITNAGRPPMLDREKRAESMRVGVEFARRWGLAGIVFHADVLLAAPKLIKFVKQQGLICASYGLANNVPDNARLQADSGIDMIIADRVGLVAKALGIRA